MHSLFIFLYVELKKKKSETHEMSCHCKFSFSFFSPSQGSGLHIKELEELLKLSSSFIVLCTLSYNKYIPENIILNRTFK